MRNIVLSLALIFGGITVAPSSSYAIPQDKQAHLGASAGGTLACSALGKAVTGDKWASAIGCFALVNIAGIAKEYSDPGRGGHRELDDLYYNLAGSGASFVTFTIFF